jgi:phosphoenolpyruvate-protein phosphotransferase (PTS system enzyme I)
MPVITEEIYLQGTPICAGIAIGTPYFLSRDIDDDVPEFSIPADEVDKEIARLRQALKHSRQEIIELQKKLEKEGALEGAAILDTHLQMIQDPALTTEIEKKIKTTRKNTESIFHAVIKSYEEKFKRISDIFFKERFQDILDIYHRIMCHLRGGSRTLTNIPHNSIVFAQELSPSETAEAQSTHITGFVSEAGGETSHASIIAKAKGIPYVASVDYKDLEHTDLSFAIIDGRTGDVIINPKEHTLAKYRELQKQLTTHIKNLEHCGNLKAETIDGYTVSLSANIEMCNDLDILHEYGSDGIGLFRSEYICLSSDTFPTEEEQFAAYKNIVDEMKGLPVVIRTFDIGGDKFHQSIQDVDEESNPFLGCRAIRLLLKRPDIFKTQLRAILRASAFGPIKIMFPMISGLPELKEAKEMIYHVQQELHAEGLSPDENIKIGCMIEVPSAAITCDLLAKECDFLSIGTNDLVQYSLAVDRGNEQMSYLYSPAHPSVIRLIKMIVTEGCRNNIPVSVCGEIAADPRYTALLLGLGVKELSVSSRYIPIVKNAIRNTSIVEAHHLAENVLNLATADEIQDLLVEEYQKSFPHDFFFSSFK